MGLYKPQLLGAVCYVDHLAARVLLIPCKSLLLLPICVGTGRSRTDEIHSEYTWGMWGLSGRFTKRSSGVIAIIRTSSCTAGLHVGLAQQRSKVQMRLCS